MLACSIIHFLTNVECLEGLFDTYGTFGRGFLDNLTLGGPEPIGVRKANLSAEAMTYMEEVALNEQVNVVCREGLNSLPRGAFSLPCPTVCSQSIRLQQCLQARPILFSACARPVCLQLLECASLQEWMNELYMITVLQDRLVRMFNFCDCFAGSCSLHPPCWFQPALPTGEHHWRVQPVPCCGIQPFLKHY